MFQLLTTNGFRLNLVLRIYTKLHELPTGWLRVQMLYMCHVDFMMKEDFNFKRFRYGVKLLYLYAL